MTVNAMLPSCVNHPDAVEGIRYCGRCGRTHCSDCLIPFQNTLLCGHCKHEQILDVRSGVATRGLDLASLTSRFGALFIDGLITGIPIMVAVGVLIGMAAYSRKRHLDQSGSQLLVFIILAVIGMLSAFAYEGFMLSRNGQTLGKKALGIKVVRPDGTPISRGQAWGRSAMRHAMISYLSTVDLLTGCFTKERTAIHDLVAKTRVVNVW